MEEDNSQSFAGGQSAEFASLDDPEKLGGLGNDSSVDDGFISVPQTDPTAEALAKCEKYVLRPYVLFLKGLGWTPFSRYGDTLLQKILRALLIVLWLLVISVTCVTQIMSCFRRDSTVPAPRMTMNGSNGSNVSVQVITCEEHVISAFILTDMLLFASYFFGLYLFSREETEYLSNLASKVFIKNAKDSAASNRLVWTILAYIVLGLAWVMLSLMVRIMTTASVEMWKDTTVIVWRNRSSNPTVFRGAGKEVLIVLDLIGFLFFDFVYVAAVVNYAAQSEMNIYLLDAIKKLVQDKGYPGNGLEASIKDIIECRKYLRVLNGKTATATALILFNLGSAGITAIINLEKISQSPVAQFNNTALATVTAGFNVILWVGLVSFPFIQAARVTDSCLKLKAMGPELRARPQLYASCPQLELDSYVNLTRAVRLRATMFGIPIYPWMWWVLFSGVTFTALILFQTGIYSFTVYL